MQYSRGLKKNAQALRRNMTKEERKLWFLFLRDLPIAFHRQKMFGTYIVDFYCAAHKLVIEIDGSQHFAPEAVLYDAERERYLNGLGITVVRYNNHEINSNFDGVCEDIMRRLGLAK